MRWWLAVIVLGRVVAGAAPAAEEVRPRPSGALASPLDLSAYDLHLAYANDFNTPQGVAREEDLIEQAADGSWRRRGLPDPNAEWIAEGWGGAEVREGRLRVASSPFDGAGRPRPVDTNPRSHMVVWNRRVFPADLLIEFEMSPCGSTNGLTIVFFCAAGKDGKDLFDLSLPPRRADYKTYHSGAIANYSDSYWSRNTEEEGLTNRLRKNPGFALAAAGPSRTTGPTDVTHRIRILKVGAHMEVEVNGQMVLQWDDPAKPLGAGRIGFRSMQGVTMVTYEHIKVWDVRPKSAVVPPAGDR
jgi:hypothetical protein